MNAQRYKAIEEGQSAIARKVLSVVPLQEPWGRNEICFELRRLGSQPDTAVVDGCLRCLLEAGLIREAAKGRYLRLQPKDPAAKAEGGQDDAEAEKAEVEQPRKPAFTLTTPAPSKRAFDRLAGLAADMRSLASSLVDMADQADELALKFEEERAGASAEVDKLRQLKALLKDLG